MPFNTQPKTDNDLEFSSGGNLKNLDANFPNFKSHLLDELPSRDLSSLSQAGSWTRSWTQEERDMRAHLVRLDGIFPDFKPLLFSKLPDSDLGSLSQASPWTRKWTQSERNKRKKNHIFAADLNEAQRLRSLIPLHIQSAFAPIQVSLYVGDVEMAETMMGNSSFHRLSDDQASLTPKKPR